MTKRIISLILVAVLAVLTLAGCAYSYRDDDMTKYATFDKEAFAKAIAEIDIIDGDFTEDEETREKKVIDKINATLAGKADSTVHKSEGTPGEIDTVYYCYYVTAEIDGVTYTFLTENMKVVDVSKQPKIQLGQSFPGTTLNEKLIAALSAYEFKKDGIYEQVTSGETTDGMVVYLSYVRTYQTEKDGATVDVTETASADRVVLNATENAFHEKLIGKTVGATISGNIEVAEGDYKGTYSKVKIEWAEKGGTELTFTDVTYDESTNKPTTVYQGTTKNKDLKGIELTYHVYPVYFVETPEFTAEVLINDIYGESVTLSAIATILFGEDYTEGEEDEVTALLDKYSFTVDGKELKLEDFVTALDNAQTTLGDKDEACEKALDDYEKAKTAKETADKAVTDAKAKAAEAKAAYEANATDANKTALDNANAAVTEAEKKATTALKDVEVAKELYDGSKELATEGTEGAKGELKTATEKRDAIVKEFVLTVGEAVEGEGEASAKGAEKLIAGYEKNVVYAGLESTYNSDVEKKIATFVYDAIIKNVKVTSYPKKAVKEANDYLIENYEYMFYENKTVSGGSVSSTSDSNYKKYGGSFKTFLVEYAVPEDLGVDVKSYDEAIAAINKEAERHVGELIAINIVAQAYGKAVTDDEWKDYKDNDDNYLYYGESYTEGTFLAAIQFDKIMDMFLESEEGEDGRITYANDYVKKVNRLTEEAYEEKYPAKDDTETE